MERLLLGLSEYAIHQGETVAWNDYEKA